MDDYIKLVEASTYSVAYLEREGGRGVLSETVWGKERIRNIIVTYNKMTLDKSFKEDDVTCVRSPTGESSSVEINKVICDRREFISSSDD